MKIVVDQERCSGHARCHAIDPELFTLDDVGYSNVTSVDVPSGREGAARDAALSCPEMAVRIEE
jgi:ferredoxin